MEKTELDKITGWFAGRLPEGWFTGAPSVTVDEKQVLVVGYYNRFLHRNPDNAGLSFWVNYLLQGHSEDALILGLVSSQEYFNNL